MLLTNEVHTRLPLSFSMSAFFLNSSNNCKSEGLISFILINIFWCTALGKSIATASVVLDASFSLVCLSESGPRYCICIVLNISLLLLWLLYTL